MRAGSQPKHRALGVHQRGVATPQQILHHLEVALLCGVNGLLRHMVAQHKARIGVEH